MSVLHHMQVLLTAETKDFQADLKSAGGATKNFANEAKSAGLENSKLGQGFKTLTGFSLTSAAAIGAVGAAVGAAAKFAKDAVNDTVAYNKEIREMSQVTGMSSEETSRLVQVADDWGVEIGQVRVAMQMMMKNGVQPSIENLAALADEYVTTSDKTAFAAKASELLGRQWTTLIPLLAQGGDALRDQAAAVNDNLIATEAEIAATREYEVAMDNLGDSATGLKMTLGNALAPVLADIANGINNDISWIDRMNIATKELDQAVGAGIITQLEGLDMLRQVADGTMSLKDITDLMTTSESGLTDERKESITVMGEAKLAQDLLKASVDEGTGALDLAKAAIQGSNLAMAEKKRLTDELKLATGELTQKDKELKTNVDILTGMLENKQITWDQWLDAIEMLNVEGTTFAGVLEAIRNKIEALPDYKQVVIDYNVRHTGGGQVGGEDEGAPLPPGGNLEPGLTPGGQQGLDMVVPPGFPHDTFPVRASSGERVIIIPQPQNSYTLNVYTNSRQERIVDDFNSMKAWARS